MACEVCSLAKQHPNTEGQGWQYAHAPPPPLSETGYEFQSSCVMGVGTQFDDTRTGSN